MNVVETLKAGRALISRPSTWDRLAPALGADGNLSWPGSPDAVIFCSLGALLHVCGNDDVLLDKAYDALEDNCGDLPLMSFNMRNTHRDVLRMWDKSIRKASK